MNLPASSLFRSGSERFRVRVLAMVLMATSSLLTPAAGAAGATPSAPPDFPDSAHVENGCYISTTAYLGKFAAAFPRERGTPVTVRPRNFDEPHTIALLSWQGRWWGRDEESGVFAVNRAVGSGAITDRIKRSAEAALERHSIRRGKARGSARDAVSAVRMSADARKHDVLVAAALLPGVSEVWWVSVGGEEWPFLFFRPVRDRVAVYDPRHGTATAETAVTHAGEIVQLVAERLGYRVTSVRPDLTPEPRVMLAAVTWK